MDLRAQIEREIFGQSGHDIRLEWSAEGVAALGRECAVLVVVDVLSFSTTVDLAVSRGGRVRPLRWGDSAARAAAAAEGATVPDEHGHTLRPSWVLRTPPGAYIAVASPNGATLCLAAAETGAEVLAGCLRNARAVAAEARVRAAGQPIGVVPAGERWQVDVLAPAGTVGPLRPCVEDHLGAGAIVDALIGLGLRWPSPEASLAARAFRAAGPDVGSVVAGSASGKELIDAGYGGDVDLAIGVNRSTVAPRLVNGVFQHLPLR
ncbi:2-phosphosulfolactate phosphatase [Amycolatopsis arida]|uniref:Probable 2-phosphosulfolactate phosphatase n=1 Tax=Amycolatopsis arida TaxID=587909 RepID=A0A1I5UMS3_9PSEU|nr:2-phosphosulfolactate phosphatase [Amycolatopsis arida]TDX90958.1 2-phosphosulfolactate phosphatase [Amycolatopsis arida]SFP96535.1 2-phosphosulfolactate phosphatase [Amycolatopsis arida]